MRARLRVWLRALWQHLGDPYPPEAADAPGLDCGHQPGGATYTCMRCDHTRCNACHYGHQQACHADLMAVADAVRENDEPTVEIQRAEAWTGDNVTVPRDLKRRLSEGWIAYAEAEMDWHAHDYEITGRRTEVSTDGR